MESLDLISAVDPALLQPIFLVGCIRSGTTLLSQMLDCYPEICYCPFELKHIWSKSGHAPMASPKTHDSCCPSLTSRDASIEIRNTLLIEFNKELIAKKFFKPSGSYFLNKNPHLSNKLEFVSSLFPQAKFIWIVRELTPMAASTIELFKSVYKSTNTWHIWPLKDEYPHGRCWSASFDAQKPVFIDSERIFPGGNIQFIAEYWLETNQLINKFAKTNQDHPFVTVRYEDLISNPRDCIRKISKKLNIPFSSYTDCISIDTSRNHLWHTRLSSREMKAIQFYISIYHREIAEVLSLSNR